MLALSIDSFASSSAPRSSSLRSSPAGPSGPTPLPFGHPSSSASYLSLPRRSASAQTMLLWACAASASGRSEEDSMDIQPIPFVVDITRTPDVVPFFDPATNTISYIVHDPDSTACAVIDSVMD